VDTKGVVAMGVIAAPPRSQKNGINYAVLR